MNDKKLATAFYSAAVPHEQISGLYQASFAIPGEVANWVQGADGKPRTYRDAAEAELAGFRVMAAKLNRARGVQSFKMRTRGQIKTFRAPEREEAHSVETVFGKRN